MIDKKLYEDVKNVKEYINVAFPVNIQKDNKGYIWINGERFYVDIDTYITTHRDIYDIMKLAGKEILPEDIFELYEEILSVGTIFIRGLK